MSVPERLERTLLFVPGNQPKMMAKAVAAATDAVCLDLEDAVPAPEKAASRALVARALRELDFGGRLRVVRINGLDTEFAYRDLVEVVEAAGDRLDLVMLPKAGGADEVMFVHRMLEQIERAQGWTGRPPIGIEAQIESARGFVNCREIAAASPRLEALIFGAGDYAASVRMPATGIGEFGPHDEVYPGHRFHSVMHTIVATARAYGLRCIDSPYGAYQDQEGFTRSCRIGLAMGFDGKQCIHPRQLETARATFTPEAAQVEGARRVLSAYAESAAAGRGAFNLDGRMIDAANLRLAQVLVERAERCAAADGRAAGSPAAS